jgi:putative ABC transport system permease protein
MNSAGDSFYLAWCYLRHHQMKTLILVLAIATISFLPAGLNTLVAKSAEELIARAQATPLLIGAKGSALELVLSALYFSSDPPPPARYGEIDRIVASGLAEPIPLHVRFRVRDQPIVGTTLEYFDFRGLRLGTGRRMAQLGECVLGAEAAQALGVGVGDVVVSSPESAFDLGGVYPLELNVVGVLARAFGPDDNAVLVDIKTAWVMEGIGHGHQDLTTAQAESAVMSREEGRITANASVVEFNRITDANRQSFHFHGDHSEHPVSAIIAVPHDVKSRGLLMGRYAGGEEVNQVIRPAQTMAQLLETVFTVRSYLVAAMGVVALATVATASLVFMLSFRLRKREIETMIKIGGARTRIAAVLASEVVVVVSAGLLLAGLLTWITERFGSEWIRVWLSS